MADPAGDADTLSEIAYQDEIKKTKKKNLKKRKKSLVFSCMGCPVDSEREGFESSPKTARCWVEYSEDHRGRLCCLGFRYPIFSGLGLNWPLRVRDWTEIGGSGR